MVQMLMAAKPSPVRNALEGFLQGDGYQVAVADNGGDALRLIKQSRFSLLLTEARMPVMDGVALSLAARVVAPRMKILMTSEDFTIAGKLHTLDVRVDGILQKPFCTQDLRWELDRLLPGRRQAA